MLVAWQSGWVLKRAVIYLTGTHSPIINTLASGTHPTGGRASKWRSEWELMPLSPARWKSGANFLALQPRSLSFSCSLSTRGWFIGEVKGDEKLTLLALAQCGLFRCVASCARPNKRIIAGYKLIHLPRPPPERREQSAKTRVAHRDIALSVYVCRWARAMFQSTHIPN